VGHTPVANITIAAIVAIGVKAELLVWEIYSEAEEIVAVITVLGWNRS
jgi:hypothetical protein